MSGVPWQYNSYVNNNNYGNSSFSGDEDEWNGFNDLDTTAPWQTLDDLWAQNTITQFPPMLPADATLYHQTLPLPQGPPMFLAAATQHHQTLSLTQVPPMLPAAATQHHQTLPLTQAPLMLPAAATQHHQTLPLTQVPPMLPAAATQHHQTLPQHVNQIVPDPVEVASDVPVPSHVPIEAQVQNGGGSKVQQNGGSSVCRKAGKGLAWTEEEHGKFLHWLPICGKGNWKAIAKHIPTKSSTQIASHAQKYYLRQNASPQRKKRKSIHDITLNTVSQQNDPQNSTPHHPEIHQMQEMLPLNLPNNMTHHMREFEYFANQQAHPDPEIHQMQEMLPLNPPSNMTHHMS